MPPQNTTSFRWQNFALYPKSFTFDNWGLLPSGNYLPREGREPIGERLPIDWEASYKEQYQQFFQPAIFYRNAVCLTNLAAAKPSLTENCASLFDELFDTLIAHSVAENDCRFVVNRFDFPRYGQIIPSGWSGSIMNAFALAGLSKAQRIFRKPAYVSAAEQFARAFLVTHRAGSLTPSRWISYIDNDGYLWFDEYPLPDGTASMVLNGHIFSVFALSLHFDLTGSPDVRTLIDAGLTTIKCNVMRFRRPRNINLYDLRNNKADYAPNRTVKQQAQLYSLTQDDFFRGMAYIFYQDLKDAKYSGLGEWALSPINSIGKN